MADPQQPEKKVIHFVLPSLPTSKNRLHKIDFRNKRVYLSDEARRWKSDMQPFIPRYTLGEGVFLYLGMEFYYPFHHANGKLRIFDAPNMQELLQDTICMRWGINDCFIKDWHGVSVDDANERAVITVTELKGEDSAN